MTTEQSGQAGGKARAAKLTKAQRSAIAKKAADKRWGEDRAPTPAPSVPQAPSPGYAFDAKDPPAPADRERDPNLYNRLFNTPDGQKVLDDLAARYYYVKTYVPGGLDAQRESDARGHRRDVLDYIIKRTSMVSEKQEPADVQTS